jgi:hypothetical protein
MRILKPAFSDRRLAFLLIAAGFVVYAAVYIWRLSVLVADTRYFTLADDQMISMRYAENLAGGHGLVWNAGGERVEGYTNFLWYSTWRSSTGRVCRAR